MKKRIIASSEPSLADLIRQKARQAKADMTEPFEKELYDEVMALINEAAAAGKDSITWKRSNYYYTEGGYALDALRNVFEKLEGEGFKVLTERSMGRNGRGATIAWW